MKKCTWCGKEYPDGVKLCAIDHQPLQPIEQAITPEQSPDSSAKAAGGRPAAITIVCVVGFISGLFTLITVATHADEIGRQNLSYVPIMALNSLIVVISMVGLFNMRRWGLYTYTGLCIGNQILKLAMGGHWDEVSILRIGVQGIALVIGFAYLSKMK